MITNNDIKNILKKKLSLNKVHINNYNNHFHITIIDDELYFMNKIKRQQIIYKPLTKYIKNNEIHSISMNFFPLQKISNHSPKTNSILKTNE